MSRTYSIQNMIIVPNFTYKAGGQRTGNWETERLPGNGPGRPIDTARCLIPLPATSASQSFNFQI